MNYKKVFTFINSIQDSLLKKQWKRISDDLMKEVKTVNEMLKATRSLVNPNDDIEEFYTQFSTPKAGSRFNSPKETQQPRYYYSRDNLPNDFEEAPGVKIYVKDYRSKDESKEMPKKDPDVWDPPSPRPARKSNNTPTWAKPKAVNHQQRIKGGGAGTGCMSNMGGNVNYRQVMQGEIARNYDKPWVNNKGTKSPDKKSVTGDQ
jgi:hypothetical protein